MKDLYLKDETFDINSTGNYYLSIQLSLSGFSFCVLDINYMKYVVLYQHSINQNFADTADFAKYVRKVFEQNELLQRQFKGTSIIYISDKSTLIPEEFISVEKSKQYFEFNQNLDELEELHCKTIDLGYDKINALFSIPNYLAIDILKFQPKAKIFNQCIPIIKCCAEKSKKESGKTKVYSVIQKDFFDISVFNSGKLKLYNTFKYRNENELVYFILNIFKQLSLDQLNDELILAGKIEKTSLAYEMLDQYLNKLKFSKPTDDFTYSYMLNKVPAHYFTQLFYLYNCE